MTRGRRNAKREDALRRQIEQSAREAAIAAAGDRLTKRWGSERSALGRLSALSRELEQLHKLEARLLAERDELVGLLRLTGSTWAALSSRTKLSRQALMKRIG